MISDLQFHQHVYPGGKIPGCTHHFESTAFEEIHGIHRKYLKPYLIDSGTRLPGANILESTPVSVRYSPASS
ncbi:MAG: hypothetical protein R3250_06055 [Melioribacteraceae bacterium]|nr:hypothetical protein [Melioribacteraceae bacterium]